MYFQVWHFSVIALPSYATCRAELIFSVFSGNKNNLEVSKILVSDNSLGKKIGFIIGSVL